jgi:hypothetical protein
MLVKVVAMVLITRLVAAADGATALVVVAVVAEALVTTVAEAAVAVDRLPL